VQTLDEKLADDRQNKEAEYACLREQNDKDLAELDARIKSAKEERRRVEEELLGGEEQEQQSEDLGWFATGA
jgi:hypothetical protein